MGKVYDFFVKGLNFSQCPYCGNTYPLRKNPGKSSVRVCPSCRKYYTSDGVTELDF